jgi:hypothetical protein
MTARKSGYRKKKNFEFLYHLKEKFNRRKCVGKIFFDKIIKDSFFATLFDYLVWTCTA